jgi:3-methyladenine DNA glycosylase AlkD
MPADSPAPERMSLPLVRPALFRMEKREETLYSFSVQRYSLHEMENDVQDILKTLKRNGSARNRAGMARFGITVTEAYGVPVPKIRALAKTLGKDHVLASKLWKSGNHEARLLATMIDDPALVTRAQADSWIKGFDSWDVCDQACMNLLDKTPFAFQKAVEWSKRTPEFEKRAGFALMAALASHDKTSDDERFLPFLRAVLKASDDDRNFVKKAVNWALRGIGKRNRKLNVLATHAADLLRSSESKSARWIGADAYRELTNPATKKRLSK